MSFIRKIKASVVAFFKKRRENASAFFKKNTLAIVIAVAAVIVITGGVIFALANMHPQNENIVNVEPGVPPELDVSTGLSIIAEKDTVSGIEKDSGFIIKSPQAISVAQITSQLSMSPAVTYELLQRTDTELYLKTNGELAADTVYNILIAENDYEPPMSWAFQTKNSFRVTSTFPANDGRAVPVESGIELHFSQDVADISKYVGFSPMLTGRCERVDDKTVVFMPGDAMEYDTTYTITLAADIRSQSNDALPEEYSFSFTTQSPPDKNYRHTFYPYDGISETFTSTDPIFIKLYAYSDFADKEVQVALYRYSGFDAYMTALNSGRQGESEFLPTAGLTKLLEYKDRLLMNSEMYWNIAFLPLQENPGLGWYLLDIQTPAGAGETDNQHAQKLLQITDISVYSQTANNQMLFWLNDAQNGQPIAGAEISVAGQKASSDQNGLALLDIPVNKSDDSYWYDTYYGYNYYEYDSTTKEVRIQHDGRLYGEYLACYGDNEAPLHKLYYSYVFTDREAYLPDDTVRFWGMILPRTSNSAKPERILLDWTDGGRYPDGIEVEVRADGSFMGEIPLAKHVSGWEYVNFTLGGKSLVGKSITIKQYVKPVYTADLTVDKDYYRKNDKINVTAIANFYDGTPAEGLEVSLQCNYSSDNSVKFRIDENGRGQAAFNLSTGTSWNPRYDYIDGNTIGAEDESIYFNTSYLVFPSDYMTQNSVTMVEGGFVLDVAGYSIDFNRVDSGEYKYYYNDEILCGASADLTGEGQLYQVEYIKRKTSDYYDFINKVVVERFTYDRQETMLETFPITTENGHFTSQPFNYANEEYKYYYFKLYYTCPDGSKLEETRYVHGYRDYYYDDYTNNYKRYYFKNDQSEDEDSYYYYYRSSGSFSLSEKINMRLSDQDNQTPGQGRLLYTVLGKELFSYQTINGSRFSLDFKPEYVPNAVVVGAYFDGKHIFSVFPSYIDYRYKESELNIVVKPDKERYQPGDEVRLEMRVTDQQGRSRAANYLLSVVDEAAFAIEAQNANPLGRIYESYYIGYRQYASYIQPYDIESGAECGEGDSDMVRRDFLDTAAFISGQTNAAGEATITFKLADNITSWRLTSIAFYESMVGAVNMPYVGKDVHNIESGLPFFLNQVLNERYLAGDSVGLTLRGAGSAIRNSDTVNYQITLTVGEEKIEKTAQSRAGDFCLVDLGTLPVGTYKVLMRASCGSYSDAVEKEIQVVDSLLLTSRHYSGDLKDGLNISAKRFPVNITFYDVDNKLFYNILYQMLYAYGQRADQIIARALAGQRLNAINGDSRYSEELALDGDEAYNWRNGLRLFPYAETDTLLTAKAAAVAPEFLNQAALADYFWRVIQNNDSDSIDVAAAYMGLGALKQPVLLDLRKLFAQTQKSQAFLPEETLYLATGLALLGDNSTVSGWYEDIIHSKLTAQGNTLCYKQSGNEHDDYQMTAAAAMLACLLNHSDHRPLLSYLTSNRSATYLPLLELAAYVGKYSPKPDSAAVFSYQLAGDTVRHEFDKRRQLYLELGETQLAEANFQVIQGNVGYNAHYFGGFDEAEKTLPPGVNISHKLSSESVKLGDVVTVTTTITFGDAAPVGYYHISQIVPTGLRFTRVRDYDYYYSNWYYRLGEGGMIDLYINPLRNTNNDWSYSAANASSLYDRARGSRAFNQPYMPASVTVNYEARAVLPGTYIMEAPAISYSGSNTLYAGERHSITVVK